MADPDPHRLVSCPYTKAHQIEHYRLHIHLQKCRKQHPNCKKVVCPFNASHVIGDMELDFHMTTCKNRMVLDNQIYVMDNDYRPIVEMERSAPPNTEENWDDDTVTTSYVPDPSKKGPHIITKIKGATPSERRKARMEAIATYRPRE